MLSFCENREINLITMTEEKNEVPASVNGEAGNVSGNIETSETKTEAVVEKQPVNNQPKPSHLRQRWKRKPSAGTVATIREDTTPQPKELKTVEIPTAERLNYPKETFGRSENRNRHPRERDERHGNGEHFGGRNRRENFDGGDMRREKNCSGTVRNRPKKLPAVAGNTANKNILTVARTVPADIVDRAVVPVIVLREIAASSRSLTENPFMAMSEYKNRAIGGNFCGCK